MNIFSNFITQRLAARQVAMEENYNSYDKATQEGKERLIIATENMTNKPCPIQAGKCSVECVHFREGDSYVSNHWQDDGSYRSYVTAPKCKLWR